MMLPYLIGYIYLNINKLQICLYRYYDVLTIFNSIQSDPLTHLHVLIFHEVIDEVVFAL